MEDRKLQKKSNPIRAPSYNLQNDGEYYNQTLKFNGKQGHGFAAERANNLVDHLKGDKAIVLDEYVKNGPDRIVNGIKIQSKYCKSAQATVNNCFKGKQFKYSGQQIEVPPEQFEDVKRLFQKRGMGNVEVRKGHVSYKVAKNIAKSGTIEGLTYDAVNGIQLGANAFGISAVFAFAFTLWQGGSIEDCLTESLKTASSVFGVTVFSHLLSQQFARSSLNGFAHKTTLNILKKVLNKDQFAAFANSFRGEGAKKIYGAPAQQNVAKMVKGQAVFAAGILLFQTGWDVIKVTNGKISGKQLAKNFLSNAGSAGGGIAGAVYGTCIGGPIGGIVGGIIGGLVSGFIVKSIADQITPDDLEEMAEILQNVVKDLQLNRFMLSQVEFEAILTDIQTELSRNNDFLQNMFENSDQIKYAKRKLKPKFKEALRKRRFVKVTTETQRFMSQMERDN